MAGKETINLRRAIAYLNLILAEQHFYEDEERAIKKTLQALETKSR